MVPHSDDTFSSRYRDTTLLCYNTHTAKQMLVLVLEVKNIGHCDGRPFGEDCCRKEFQFLRKNAKCKTHSGLSVVRTQRYMTVKRLSQHWQ